jgi:ribose transport system permease protein
MSRLRLAAGSSPFGGAVLTPLVLLAVVWIAFSSTDPGFASSDSVFAVLQGFAFLGLITLALGVTMLAGELDLSVGSVAAVAGILAVQFLSLGLLPALAIATLCAAVFGAAQGACIARLRINSVVFTIGTMFALRGLAYVISGERAVQIDIAKLSLSDGLIERIWIFSPFSLITLAILGAVGMVLAVSKWGREVYAVGGGRPESIAAGVPQRRPIVLSFTISATAAGLAGALASISSGSGAPFAFETVLLLGVTAALVGGVSLYGGRGTVLNILLGALILQSFTAGLSSQGTSQGVQQLAIGGLLLIAIVVEFAAGRLQRAGRWRSKRAVVASQTPVR